MSNLHFAIFRETRPLSNGSSYLMFCFLAGLHQEQVGKKKLQALLNLGKLNILSFYSFILNMSSFQTLIFVFSCFLACLPQLAMLNPLEHLNKLLNRLLSKFKTWLPNWLQK